MEVERREKIRERMREEWKERRENISGGNGFQKERIGIYIYISEEIG